MQSKDLKKSMNNSITYWINNMHYKYFPRFSIFPLQIIFFFYIVPQFPQVQNSNSQTNFLIFSILVILMSPDTREISFLFSNAAYIWPDPSSRYRKDGQHKFSSTSWFVSSQTKIEKNTDPPQFAIVQNIRLIVLL